MQVVKQMIKKIPGISYLYRSLRNLYLEIKWRHTETNEIFVDIFKRNKFGGKDSFSGPGSDLYQTRVLIEELPAIFLDLGISTILDIPCGDFHWMRRVCLDGVDYIGADIVYDLIQTNNEKYRCQNITFLQMNLINDALPKVDLLFCRDCLVHFSFRDIFSAFQNICHSGSKYLLTTTFPSRKKNHNICTGDWRPLNLEIAPFNFPGPLRRINEVCTEGEGAYRDKSLGLWRIAEIEKVLFSKYFL